MKKLMLLGVLILSLFGCKTMEQMYVEDGYRELKGEELKQMLVGNTEVSNGISYYFHDQDGTFYGTSSRGNRRSGAWNFEKDGRLYRKWNDSLPPGSGISKIFIHDKNNRIEWIDPDGQSYSTTFLNGNPKKFTK